MNISYGCGFCMASFEQFRLLKFESSNLFERNSSRLSPRCPQPSGSSTAHLSELSPPLLSRTYCTSSGHSLLAFSTILTAVWAVASSYSGLKTMQAENKVRNARWVTGYALLTGAPIRLSVNTLLDANFQPKMREASPRFSPFYFKNVWAAAYSWSLKSPRALARKVRFVLLGSMLGGR